MEARLTEFSYGYCVTEELANGTGPGFKAAPYFPSLYTEGKKGGGFDVQIGSALFLQFKLSEELRRRSARETRKGLLEPTFFRFWLHRRDRSSQHQMLIDLESQVSNEVYYIAPEFADVNSLDRAYNGYAVRKDSGVVAQSAMFSPRQIGPLTDDGYHSVAFRPGEAFGWFLSGPKQVRVERARELIQRALSPPNSLDGSAYSSASNVRDWLSGLVAQMKQIVQHYAGYRSNDAQSPTGFQHDRGPLEDVAYLARTHFGCEFFLLARPHVAGA
jgi:hypothetical protein